MEHKGYNNVVSGTENKFKTFQGQELEEELGKNTLAFQWRDYDPAIGRFNKIDRFAEKYHPISPYTFTANNPLKFLEIKGDSLKVANNDQTKEYLNSAAKKRNQDFIKYDDDGNVSLDFGDLSEKKIARRLKNDSGLSVINDMVNATDSDGKSENFYFEVSNNREGVIDGESFNITLSAKSGDVVTNYSWFDNFSTTSRGDGLTNVTPANGYDGSVFISPGRVFDTNISYRPLDIGGIVRHELRENFSRTHDKKSYTEAHESAGFPSSFTKFIFD